MGTSGRGVHPTHMSTRSAWKVCDGLQGGWGGGDPWQNKSFDQRPHHTHVQDLSPTAQPILRPLYEWGGAGFGGTFSVHSRLDGIDGRHVSDVSPGTHAGAEVIPVQICVGQKTTHDTLAPRARSVMPCYYCVPGHGTHYLTSPPTTRGVARLETPTRPPKRNR